MLHEFTPGRNVVLEASAGPTRQALLDNWLSSARAHGYQTFKVSGAVEEHGVWAGLDQILWSILARARAVAPGLVERHSYELCVVLPSLRRELEVKNPCLTDVAQGEEKVRNYANDRAYRTLHGIIDFLATWAEIDPSPTGWAIACDAFDSATTLVQRFYKELARRRGAALRLTLLVSVEPGRAADAGTFFEDSAPLHTVVAALPARKPRLVRRAAARAAEALERRMGDDRIEWSLHIPRVITLWQRSNTPERALPWLQRALGVYNHDGLYEISVRYAPEVEAALARMLATDPQLYARSVLGLFFSYAALGRADDALRLVLSALPSIGDPLMLTDLHYDLAMLYARFLKQRDLDRAEVHLEHAMALIPTLSVPEARKTFLQVFMRNGLAYVRFRQGRAEEAIQLCESGLRELDAALPPEQHRLHRSVLLFNAAQVLGTIGRTDQAIDALSQAMDMDPNYSEYYLERGSLLLKLGQFEAAEADLLRAIELSPPYAESWTDLGQCYRAMGRFSEADAAYSRALDLDPRVVLALIGRADSRAERGDLAGALADYDRAVALEPNDALLLGARAVVLYDSGRVAESLADLDRAIALAPDNADLHANRVVALESLARAA